MTENSNFLKNTFLVKPYWGRRCDICPNKWRLPEKPHLMRVLSINCCLLVKLYITLEQKFFKNWWMLYKNLFLLWNNKYFLILPLNVISTGLCISGQTLHLHLWIGLDLCKLCIYICGLINGFNITNENYSNTKVSPCQTAQ